MLRFQHLIGVIHSDLDRRSLFPPDTENSLDESGIGFDLNPFFRDDGADGPIDIGIDIHGDGSFPEYRLTGDG